MHLYVILKGQQKDKVADLVLALKKQTQNVINTTGNEDAKNRMSIYNNFNIEDIPDTLVVYSRTWDYYLGDKNAGFGISKTQILPPSNYTEVKDVEGNDLSVGDEVFIYVENFGATRASITKFSDSGIFLKLSPTREFYLHKDHYYRLLKV